jgi:ABC-2 type transport system permease protein
LTAKPFFGGALPANWLNFALLTLLSVFAFGAIGLLIGVIAEGARSTVLWSQLIFLPSMLLGGLMMPFDFLPESVRTVALILPTTHAMQAYQGLAFAQPTVVDPVISTIVLLAGGIMAFGLAVFLFNWDSRNQARHGHPLMALLAILPFVIGMLLG